MSVVAGKPQQDEHAPYYSLYIDQIASDDIVSVLSSQLTDTLAIIRTIPEEKGVYRYAEGKWSIKELIGHIIDTERVFAYRALRFARNDAKPLEGFDQDPYILNANFDSCSLADLAAEFEHLRKANVYMFANLAAEAWSRTGLANDNKISVRALAYILAGHEKHHIDILQKRYLA